VLNAYLSNYSVRQYNDQEKRGQTIQWPREKGTDNDQHNTKQKTKELPTWTLQKNWDEDRWSGRVSTSFPLTFIDFNRWIQHHPALRTKFDIYRFIAYLTWNDTIIENKQITSKFYFLGISILIFYIFILQIAFAHYIWYLHVNYIWRNKRAFCSILIWPSFWRLTPIWWWFLVLCWMMLDPSIKIDKCQWRGSAYRIEMPKK
jgi:hypothetical protein